MPLVLSCVRDVAETLQNGGEARVSTIAEHSALKGAFRKDINLVASWVLFSAYDEVHGPPAVTRVAKHTLDGGCSRHLLRQRAAALNKRARQLGVWLPRAIRRQLMGQPATLSDRSPAFLFLPCWTAGLLTAHACTLDGSLNQVMYGAWISGGIFPRRQMAEVFMPRPYGAVDPTPPLSPSSSARFLVCGVSVVGTLGASSKDDLSLQFIGPTGWSSAGQNPSTKGPSNSSQRSVADVVVSVATVQALLAAPRADVDVFLRHVVRGALDDAAAVLSTLDSPAGAGGEVRAPAVLDAIAAATQPFVVAVGSMVVQSPALHPALASRAAEELRARPYIATLLLAAVRVAVHAVGTADATTVDVALANATPTSAPAFVELQANAPRLLAKFDIPAPDAQDRVWITLMCVPCCSSAAGKAAAATLAHAVHCQRTDVWRLPQSFKLLFLSSTCTVSLPACLRQHFRSSAKERPWAMSVAKALERDPALVVTHGDTVCVTSESGLCMLLLMSWDAPMQGHMVRFVRSSHRLLGWHGEPKVYVDTNFCPLYWKSTGGRALHGRLPPGAGASAGYGMGAGAGAGAGTGAAGAGPASW